MSNITQVVNTDKNLKTLKKGIHSSDLDQLLSSTGPFTFFAPFDLAFEKLEKGLMNNLLEPQNKLKLTDLMNNHIVSGIVTFKDLKDGDRLKTINGNELIVEVKNGTVNIGSAAIHGRDAKISNGVIHSTDTVFIK
ncbi:Uncaracterized surface protein containing fasciclin (FAS1) repeats [Chitinophaga sp. CF118]|uniref:fasciclin domain-containing protein n=1 Tax=Chitinophaga sp. CF118 TaxID=1884367 RepID=UPI0008E5AED7|nr:fasciclin domain-containing protein [Chitinophaga sp. CF118]SFE09180.1 Uncaracterized surface protein containing fasciclin (FAS1) repeats [Chitinophaga sp. CF118]